MNGKTQAHMTDAGTAISVESAWLKTSYVTVDQGCSK